MPLGDKGNWGEDGEPWGDDGVQGLGENGLKGDFGVPRDPRVNSSDRINSRKELHVKRDKAPRMPMLDVSSTDEEYETEEDQEENGDPQNPTSVRHLY